MQNKINSYLTMIQTNQLSSKTNQKMKNLNDNILNQIRNQIVQSRIIIPNHQKQLNITKTMSYSETEGMKNLDKKFKQIQMKKKTILEELSDLQHIESRIKINKSRMQMNMSSVSHGSNLELVNIGKNAKIRSEFTQQEMNEIKQIYKKQKKFNKQIKQKIKKYEEDQQTYKKQLQEQQKQKIKNLCMEKHQQRQIYIKQIKQRNRKRQKMLEQQKQKIIELKKKKKLFQQMEEKFLNCKQIQKQQIKQKLQEYKKKRDLSFNDVKQHQNKYNDLKRMKDQQRQERIKNFKNANQTKFPCLFLDKIKDQDQRYTFQRQQKNQMMKTYAQKKAAYAQQVRKRLHQNNKTMSQSKLNSHKMRIRQMEQQKWLNTPQKYHKGTQYMREINQKISKLPRKVQEPQNIKLKNSQKFKNYLNDIRQSQILKKENKQNNIYQAYTNMNLKAAKQNITSQNLAQSVKAKIQIMNKLQQSRNSITN